MKHRNCAPVAAGWKIFMVVISTIATSLIPLSIQARPLTPDNLEGWCGERGGIYDRPTANEVAIGFAGCCRIPDNPSTKQNESQYTCCSTDGHCVVVVKGRIVGVNEFTGTGLITDLQIKQSLVDLKAELDSIKVDVAGIKDSFNNLQTTCETPDLLPLQTLSLTGGGGNYCRINSEGKLIIKVYNQGGADAAGSTTRVVFGCANPALCNTPTEFDVATPPLPKFGGSVELPLNIPDGCWSPVSGICDFKIGADVSNVLSESDEFNNIAVGACVQGIL